MRPTWSRWAVAVAFAGIGGSFPALSAAADFETLYTHETRDNARETLSAYIAAARGGNCAAAKRLGEIYDRGMIGIARDYAESLKWYNAARVLGCDMAVATSTTPPTPRVTLSGTDLFQTATALDADGKGPEAVKAYTHAARSGNCHAAQRLGDIYDKGLIGIPRNYPESLKWYNAARVLGCDVPVQPRG